MELKQCVMINKFCSKGSCIIHADTSNITNNIILEDNQESDKTEKDIHITIHKPKYEYVHGRKFKSSPRWIVVHYTACANVSAQSMCKAMRNNKNASSHFYIDEKDICMAVPLEYIAWHVGDGKCKRPSDKKHISLEELSHYKSSDWRYDIAAKNHIEWQSKNDDFLGNSQSIGVDLCCKKISTKTKKATDKDWYFEDQCVDNAAKTVAYLCNQYNIDLDHVIRHCDATGKPCGRPFVSLSDDEMNDEKWIEFKNTIRTYTSNVIVAEFV